MASPSTAASRRRLKGNVAVTDSPLHDATLAVSPTHPKLNVIYITSILQFFVLKTGSTCELGEQSES